jgi:hypothetical protein
MANKFKRTTFASAKRKLLADSKSCCRSLTRPFRNQSPEEIPRTWRNLKRQMSKDINFTKNVFSQTNHELNGLHHFWIKKKKQKKERFVRIQILRVKQSNIIIVWDIFFLKILWMLKSNRIILCDILFMELLWVVRFIILHVASQRTEWLHYLTRINQRAPTNGM